MALPVEKPVLRSGSQRFLSIWARFWIALAIGAVGTALVSSGIHIYARVLMGWSAGALCFMALLWPVIQSGDPRIAMQQAHNVSSRALITLVATTLASLLATGFMLADLTALPPRQRFTQVVLSVLALVVAWFLNNLVFGLRYGYLYYRGLEDRPDATPLVAFQGAAQAPVYWDFLYLAFEVGMTFGVTDTALLSVDMRRVVLGHAILSFWFNTVILALTLNLVAGLL